MNTTSAIGRSRLTLSEGRENEDRVTLKTLAKVVCIVVNSENEKNGSGHLRALTASHVASVELQYHDGDLALLSPFPIARLKTQT